MNGAPAHHLFLAALVLGTATMLLPIWAAWPPPGDAAAAVAARANFAAGALCLAAVAGATAWHWRRQDDAALARYRKWTAMAIGGWAIAWAAASLLVRPA
ncbi:hypothetical protein GCM10010964_03480 [Caldovatus sediminis]|uniref:Transmembrane protein n=1 Tax=Caldovatus sediminis TaxID=2041189 RepID=A0A8J2Z8B1_9PROT|nr:hypothetical protein [Caldovatus sediminis]GGG18542.1 hypothetical protein GCM10010964_03480 [Caldovatus sediminis]